MARKLGIRPGHQLLVMNAPEGYVQTLGALSEGAEMATSGAGEFDFVQLFAREKADIDTLAGSALQAVKPGGLLWLSYPKKSSKMTTDVARDVGWGALRDAGLRPVSQVSVDETWSALRFRPTSEVKSKKA